jgi:hypothetical protein
MIYLICWYMNNLMNFLIRFYMLIYNIFIIFCLFFRNSFIIFNSIFIRLVHKKIIKEEEIIHSKRKKKRMYLF